MKRKQPSVLDIFKKDPAPPKRQKVEKEEEAAEEKE